MSLGIGKVAELTVWTRGVVMDKKARDVSNVAAQVAKTEGKFVQPFDNYEDFSDCIARVFWTLLN